MKSDSKHSKPVKGRKFAYVMIGLGTGTIFYFMNIVLVTSYPYAISAYLSLFDTIMVFLAGLISALTGAHFAMDWKNSQNNLTSIATGAPQFIESVINNRREPKDFQVPLEELNG